MRKSLRSRSESGGRSEDRSPARKGHRGQWSRVGTAATTATVLTVTGLLAGCDSFGGASSSGTGVKRASPARPPLWNRAPASVAAVGDSITRGFDACVVLADCPEVSWSTGTDSKVRSLALRLLGAPAAKEHSWNHAATGAKMSDLPGQLAQAAQNKPELVTIMVGANDACQDTAKQMTPVADFRTSFEASMRQLRAGAPKAQVYVSSVPDLRRLWSTGRGNPLGRQIWKLGICATMLGDSQDMSRRAQDRRNLVYKRVVAYNNVLRDVCAKDPRCRYDGGAVFDFRFTGEQLSHWDWFHPSKDGQSRLAEIAYRNVTAVKPPG